MWLKWAPFGKEFTFPAIPPFPIGRPDRIWDKPALYFLPRKFGLGYGVVGLGAMGGSEEV